MPEHICFTAQGSSSANLLSWNLNPMIWDHLEQDNFIPVLSGPIVNNAPETTFNQVSSAMRIQHKMGSISAQTKVEPYSYFYPGIF